MGACWTFAASAHTSREYLKDNNVHIWTEYANHLLGKFVLGILGGEDGAAVSFAEWDIVLKYEQEIRREMVTLMLKGVPLTKALKQAWNDPIVSARFRVAQLQQRTFHRAGGGGAGPPPKPPKRQRTEKGKGHGLGKGKEQGRNTKGKGNTKGLPGCASVTPQGKRICYAFNNEGCSAHACTFEHVCGKCFGSHPMHQCSQ